MSDSEILIQAENIGKKFCRSLKRSLWYGVKDIASDINPFSGNEEQNNKAQGTKHEAPTLRPDEFWALQNVSFELKRGECLGLIGHNGAGKSTLLKILNGLIRPDTGKLTIRGKVGALIELSAGFNPILTGRENVYNRGALLGFSRDEIESRFDQIVEFSEIGDFIDMPVKNYSSGMQVRLGFAISSQMEPDVLLLDEVLAVGDVAFRQKCFNAMGKLLQQSAVIFVSHSMPSIFRVSTEVLVLDHGKNLFHGDVGLGIEQYHSSQPSAGSSVGGSGDFGVSDCRIINAEHEALSAENSVLDPDSPFQIELDLKANSGIRNALVQAVVWNQQMLPVADLVNSDRRGFLAKWSSDSQNTRIRATIPFLPLNAGTYSMSICICAEDGSRVYCRHDNAAVFTVARANASGADFVVPVEWEPLESNFRHQS